MFQLLSVLFLLVHFLNFSDELFLLILSDTLPPFNFLLFSTGLGHLLTHALDLGMLGLPHLEFLLLYFLSLPEHLALNLFISLGLFCPGYLHFGYTGVVEGHIRVVCFK